MSDQKGEQVWQAEYKPFGEEFSVNDLVDNNRRFVGKEKDDETELDYFGARYLSVEAGRFLAVDPVRAVDEFSGQINSTILANPQRLNVYAYSLNNPYRYVDPDGRAVWGVNLGFSFTWSGAKGSLGTAFLFDTNGNFAIVPNGDAGKGVGKAFGVFINGVAGLPKTTVDDYAGLSSSVSGSVPLPGKKGATYAISKPDQDKTFLEGGYSPLSYGNAEVGGTVGFGKIKYKWNLSKMVLGDFGEKVYDYFHPGVDK